MAKNEIRPQSVRLAYGDYERLLQIEQEFLGQKEQQMKKRNIIKGLNGLEDLFMCPTSADRHMKNTDSFRPILVQHGCHILVDIDIAWALANKHSRRCTSNRPKKEDEILGRK